MVCNNGGIRSSGAGHSPPHRLPDGFTQVTDTGDHKQSAQNLQGEEEEAWRGERVNGRGKEEYKERDPELR